MKPSNWTGGQIENIQLLGGNTSVDTKETAMALTIVNKTRNSIEFGSRFLLEVQINGVWYNIDNMINDNINLSWILLLYSLAADKSKEENFQLNYYQPLPIGRYRLVKEVTNHDSSGYVAFEFDVK
jgi:hypothetical protein